MPRRSIGNGDRFARIAVAFVALASVAAAQSSKSLVGIHEIEPGLVHPIILPKLKERSRSMEGLDLGLHPSVPMRVTLTHGKRLREYLIEGEPKLGITRLILPGLVNNKLRYGPKRERPVRFEIWDARDTLWITNHCGAFAELAGHEITFVDLDHDGELGSVADGYVIKGPKEKYWADPEGRVAFRAMTEPAVIDGTQYWLEVDQPGFTMVVSDRLPDFTARRDESYGRALQLLNTQRQRLGHAPIELRDELSRACEEHALYCATNDELTHDQDPKKPGASVKGAKAGKVSELTRAASMDEAVRIWLGTFYHRLSMLSPRLQRVGMGHMYGVAALDAQSEVSTRSFEPFAWPPDQAVDVPCAWGSGEVPSPLGDLPFPYEVAVLWGHPISLSFPSKAVSGVEAKLTVRGAELPVFVSSPEQPSNREFPDNACSILVMARSPLPANAEVVVEVRCVYGGKPFTKSWRFTTRAR